MDLLTSTFIGLFAGAVIIYGALRYVAGSSGQAAEADPASPAAAAATGPAAEAGLDSAGPDSTGSDETGLRAAKMHAFWTALIAFFASGLSAASQVGSIPASSFAGNAPEPSWLADLLTVLVPLVSLAGIYLIGQYTWPKPRGSVRRADITPGASVTTSHRGCSR